MKRLIAFMLVVMALSACSLGASDDATAPPIVDPENVEQIDPNEGETENVDTAPDNSEEQAPAEGETVPETGGAEAIPQPESSSAAVDQFHAISVTSDTAELRAEDPLTIRVTFGRTISSVVCTAVYLQTAEAVPLGTGIQEEVDADTQRITFTYTPTRAGDYQVTCDGTALTADGQQERELDGDIFTVEAKG